MYKPESVLENKTSCHLEGFAFSADHEMKIEEKEKTNKHSDLARELKQAVEDESEGDTKCSWCV